MCYLHESFDYGSPCFVEVATINYHAEQMLFANSDSLYVFDDYNLIFFEMPAYFSLTREARPSRKRKASEYVKRCLRLESP